MKTDKELLDWLEAQTNGKRWVARMSSNGRGFRLHNTEVESITSAKTARAAIETAMEWEKALHEH